MSDLPAFKNCPQCSATSKRTGMRCRGPAVRGWAVCRFHGAGGGAPRGERNGRFIHGQATHAAREERRSLQRMLREWRSTLAEIDQ